MKKQPLTPISFFIDQTLKEVGLKVKTVLDLVGNLKKSQFILHLSRLHNLNVESS